MQPKKQLKVQYIGIFEEIDSFYWPKMHLLKEGQKIWAWVGPPPPIIRAMPERKRFFSIDVFPYCPLACTLWWCIALFLTFMVTIISCNIWKIAMAKTVCTTGGRTSVSLQLWQLMKRLWSQTSRVNALMTRFQLMVPRPNPDVTKNLMGHRMHNAHRGSPNILN